MAKSSTPVMEVVMFGHMYNEGDRGMRGGAPKNDKVWGVARIGDKLIRFWGRRGGKLRTLKHASCELPSLREKFEAQIAEGYRVINNSEMRERLVPGLLNHVVAAVI